MTAQDTQTPPNSVLKEDKCHFADFCLRNGFSDVRPTVYAIKSNQEPGFISFSPVKFPAIFKPAIGAGSVGIQILHNISDWEKVINNNSDDERFVIEEYVGAPREHTTHFVVHNGHVEYHKTMSCRVESHGVDCFVRNGCIPQDIAEYTIVSDDHLRIFEEIFTKGNKYTGMACADYKITDRGTLCIFEINPRLGGSTKYLISDCGTIQDEMRAILDLVTENE
jgi:carbamoylphosphate synthase large subunit